MPKPRTTATIAESDGCPDHGGNVLTNDLHANGQPGADTPTSLGELEAARRSSYGTFTRRGNGTYSYTLDNANAPVQGLGRAVTLTETFNYTMRDADGDHDTATLTITITGTNDAPTVTVDDREVHENDQCWRRACDGYAGGVNGEFADAAVHAVGCRTGFDDLASVTINGTSVRRSADLHGSTIAGPHGTLTITGLCVTSDRAVSATYSYTLTARDDARSRQRRATRRASTLAVADGNGLVLDSDNLDDRASSTTCRSRVNDARSNARGLTRLQ